MSNEKTTAPMVQTQLDSEIEYLSGKIHSLEKVISESKGVFRRLDGVANKLNPDAFYKNYPVNEVDNRAEVGSKMCDVVDIQRSGQIHQIYNLTNQLESYIMELHAFIDEQNKTISFFTNNI